MFLKFRIVKAAVQILLWPKMRAYERQLKNPAATQDKLLQGLMNQLADSDYGKKCGVARGDDYNAFVKKLPIVDYEELRPSLNTWSEPPLFYERTSGSSGPHKDIPYTPALLSSFHNMFALWLHDLAVNGPPLVTGKTFISISTPCNEQRGMETDLDYLQGFMRWLIGEYFVVPMQALKLKDFENFKHVLSLTLLAQDDLEIISVWNPSFLTILLDYMADRRAVIAEDWKKGEIITEGRKFSFRKPSPARMSLLMNNASWESLWPSLKLISCWSDANAAGSANRLRQFFPQAMIQGKGLLATEAPLTLPLVPARGCTPLLGEVFFEFEDEKTHAIKRIHELQAGNVYALIITTKGGLFRYRLGDRVRASHSYFETPCLDFVGRDNSTSDLVGEKLHEDFVKSTLSELPLAGSCFQVLVPVFDKARPHYMLLVDAMNQSEEMVSQQLDQALQRSHRYREARLLGQLAPAMVKMKPDVEEWYTEVFRRRGLKWGDIKHRCLISQEVAVHAQNI